MKRTVCKDTCVFPIHDLQIIIWWCERYAIMQHCELDIYENLLLFIMKKKYFTNISKSELHCKPINIESEAL